MERHLTNHSQKSDTPAKAYRRYISTTAHIMSWYRGDVWTSGTASRTSLERVRGYHAHMAASTNDPCNRLVINRAEIPEGVRALDRGKPLLEQVLNKRGETRDDWKQRMRIWSLKPTIHIIAHFSPNRLSFSSLKRFPGMSESRVHLDMRTFFIQYSERK